MPCHALIHRFTCLPVSAALLSRPLGDDVIALACQSLCYPPEGTTTPSNESSLFPSLPNVAADVPTSPSLSSFHGFSHLHLQLNHHHHHHPPPAPPNQGFPPILPPLPKRPALEKANGATTVLNAGVFPYQQALANMQFQQQAAFIPSGKTRSSLLC